MFGHVGDPNGDGSGGTQPAHRGGVLGCDVVASGDQSACLGHARQSEAFLDAAGHSVEWRELARSFCIQKLVSLRRFPTRLINAVHNARIDVFVDLAEVCDVGVDDIR